MGESNKKDQSNPTYISIARIGVLEIQNHEFVS